MKILIVSANAELSELWTRHLHRAGAEILRAESRDAAFAELSVAPVDALILSADIGEGEVAAIAHYAAYRHPKAKVIFVSASSSLSEPGVFGMFPNLAASVPEHTIPEDITCLVSYHCGRI